MYTKDGFHKALEQKLGDDAYLLLAAGGHKKLADLLTSASLGASGNNTTLSVTVGGTTKSNSITVPYASKAGVWETERTLTIGSSGKSVDGSKNVTWSLDEIGVYSKTAADDRYVNVTGDTMQINSGTILHALYATDIFGYNPSYGTYIGGHFGSSGSWYIYSGNATHTGGPCCAINSNVYDILHAGNYTNYLGYIGTTGVQANSAIQNLTGIAYLEMKSSGNEQYINFYQNNTIKNQIDSGQSLFEIFSYTSNWRSDLAIVRSTGYIGLGTGSPRAKLDVNGYDSAIIVGNTGGYSNGTSAARKLRLGLGTVGHTGSNYWAFCIDDTTSNSYLQIGYTESNKDVSIRHDGCFGLGISNPTYRLHISGHIKLQDGALHIWPNGANFNEGIRIHASSTGGWSAILLADTTNTGDSGTNSNSWFIARNPSNNFYINRGGSSDHTGYELCNINGNWGIGTTSPSYKLHVVGDSYITGWSRAANGFYVHDQGVHFTSQGTVGEIDMTSNNEFLWGSSGSTLYFNYRTVSRGTTVTSYVWNAGSSSSWASHNMGNIWLNGSGVYLRLGPQNSSHAHYETNAGTSHWFNKRVDVNGNIWVYGTNYGIASDGNFYAYAVYANRPGSSTAGGVSLYSTSDPITEYGIAFRGTGSYGTHARVTGDWATYLTMDSSYNRGWIFRSGGTNYASISARGEAYYSSIGRDYYIAYPNGGQSVGNGSSVTGAIAIYLPTTTFKCCTMLKFTIEIYEYSGSCSTTYTVAGYNYSDSQWYNTTAYSLRQGTNGKGNLRVRFGDDGSTRNIIWIGETNTTWSYPQVYIKDVTLGHSSYDYNRWAAGWSIGFVTSFGNIRTYIDNPAINYYANNADYATSSGNADTLDGYHLNNLYWANISVQTGSDTSKFPQFGSLSVINDSQNNGTDGLVYFRHYSNNDWGLIVDKSQSYTYGVDIRAGGAYALKVGNGNTRLLGATIIGADAAPSYTLDVRGNTRSTGRIYANEWIEFAGFTGLYCPNANGAHWYPNNASSYGTWLMQGSRGGYAGIQLGASTSYMTLMDSATHKGLYQEGQRWIFYYNRDSQKVGIRDSNTTKDINLIGQTYISSNTWIGTTSGGEMLNVGGWVGTVGNTGWYSITHGGGMYMEDTTYVRVYNGKNFYVSSTGQHAIYTAGGFASAHTSGYVLSTYYNGSWYGDTIYNHGNGNLSIDAPGGSLFLAYYRGYAYFCGGSYYINRSGYFNGTSASAGNADTTDGLHAHGGRNNEANKLVRTDGNGYIQAGYINSSSGDENNNSVPARLWGTNGSDSYLRTYRTTALFQTLSFSGSTLTVKVGNTEKTCTISAGSTVTKSTSCSSNRYVVGTDSVSGNFTTAYCCAQFYFTTSGAYHTSDIRKKYDIRDIYTDEVTRLFNTDNAFIRHFKWKDTNHDAYGFIAQELAEYCPEAVDLNNDTGYYAVNYNVAFSKIIGAMYKRIKDLERRLEEKENH